MIKCNVYNLLNFVLFFVVNVSVCLEFILVYNIVVKKKNILEKVESCFLYYFLYFFDFFICKKKEGK